MRHLGGDIEPLGEQRDHRLIVADCPRLLRAPGSNRPKGPGQQASAPRAREASVRVEVVSMCAKDIRKRVGRVGDLDLDPGQTTLEKGLKVARCRAGIRQDQSWQCRWRSRSRVAPRRLGGQVMVVVAGEEDEPPADQLFADRRSRPSAESRASATEPKRKSKRSPRKISSSTSSRCGASRSKKNSSRSRSRPVQAPK